MHIPLFNFVLPSNIISTMEIYFPILGFDLLEVFINWEDSVLKFDFDGYEDFSENKIQGQVNDIGYDTPNTIITLNTLAFVLVLYIL